MNNLIKTGFTVFYLIGVIASVFLPTQITHASALREAIVDKTDDVAFESFDINKEGDAVLPATIGRVTGILLGIVGTAGVILIVYAGFLWATAGGNDDKVKKAKKIIVQVTIGIIVASLAYVLVAFIVTQILSGSVQEQKATTDGETPADDDGPPPTPGD